MQCNISIIDDDDDDDDEKTAIIYLKLLPAEALFACDLRITHLVSVWFKDWTWACSHRVHFSSFYIMGNSIEG